MSKMKPHLAGWRAREDKVFFGDGGISLHACGPYRQQIERARLIATAPKLLNQLVAVDAYLTLFLSSNPDPNGLLNALRCDVQDAIAEAGGESS